MFDVQYSGSHLDEVQDSGFSGIGNRPESKMYLTDTRIAILDLSSLRYFRLLRTLFV